ncbi:helix-turn-helix domain-containing protein [Candidatus Poriferisodalis sp.]|uniref:helix-turn-helix domain-containing protein n=1 Tax=Candidatus Poriferisodalis sp. TaxID=3101277 RepID=UPI003B013B14
MAARLSLDERVFIESSLGAGCGVADVAQRLGRDRSTVHRELARCVDGAGYDARSAHASACARARRERTPKLAVEDLTLTYDFSALNGIIFGINTHDHDKIAIIDLIKQKCTAAGRTDFDFRQAHYSWRTGQIESYPLNLDVTR